MEKYICSKCKDEYESEIEIEDSQKRLCGYCWEVRYGKPDSGWIPGVTKDELDKVRRGFHKL